MAVGDIPEAGLLLTALCWSVIPILAATLFILDLKFNYIFGPQKVSPWMRVLGRLIVAGLPATFLCFATSGYLGILNNVLGEERIIEDECRLERTYQKNGPRLRSMKQFVVLACGDLGRSADFMVAGDARFLFERDLSYSEFEQKLTREGNIPDRLLYRVGDPVRLKYRKGRFGLIHDVRISLKGS